MNKTPNYKAKFLKTLFILLISSFTFCKSLPGKQTETINPCEIDMSQCKTETDKKKIKERKFKEIEKIISSINQNKLDKNTKQTINNIKKIINTKNKDYILLRKLIESLIGNKYIDRNLIVSLIEESTDL